MNHGRRSSSLPKRGLARDRQRQTMSQGATKSSERNGIGGEQVEGRQAVRELLKAGRRRTYEVFFDQTVDRTGIVAEIASLALDRRVPLKELSTSKFDLLRRSESSQGVVAIAEPLRHYDINSLLSQDLDSRAKKVVVLDHVTDPRNLGSVLRSAECAGFEYIVLPERRSTKITPTVAKTAVGAVEYLKFVLVPGVASALEDLKKLGFWTMGLDPEATDTIWSVKLDSAPLALVLGSEGKGLSRLVRQRCDFLASIPQSGHLDSLNVSAAAAVAMFTVIR